MTAPTSIPLTVPRRDGDPIVVNAQPVTPGLYIHRTPASETARPPADRWRLAHHSGRLVGYLPSEAQARSAGRALVGLADWTLGEDELLRLAQLGEIDLYELGRVLDENGGALVRLRVLLPEDLVQFVMEYR